MSFTIFVASAIIRPSGALCLSHDIAAKENAVSNEVMPL